MKKILIMLAMVLVVISCDIVSTKPIEPNDPNELIVPTVNPRIVVVEKTMINNIGRVVIIRVDDTEILINSDGYMLQLPKKNNEK